MKNTLTAERRRKTILSVVLAVICIIYVLPVVAVVINSFKLNTYVKTDTFSLPNEESFAGWSNYIKGMTFGNYPFWKSAFYSVFITVVSSALILLCTSMADILSLRLLHGRPLPDGHVHPLQDGRPREDPLFQFC